MIGHSYRFVDVMKPILSPHDNFPRPTAWTRTTAIEAFGVTYLHDTAKGAPIREVLGKREAPPSAPGSTVTAHATDGEALAYASNLARAEAQRELDDIETHLAGKGTRLRLALARNWKPAREREVGLLATESIMDRRRRECREIIEKGVRLPVQRLPEGLRMPIVLPLHLPVHVVDMREFPMREVQLEESHIVAHSFVEVEDHPAYDVVVRYHVHRMPGSFSYDHPGLVHRTLEGTPEGLRIFLLRGAAVDHIHDFSQTVQDRLVKGLTPVVSIAPRALPSPASLAAPAPLAPEPAEPESRPYEAEVIPFPQSGDDTPEFASEWSLESTSVTSEIKEASFTEIGVPEHDFDADAEIADGRSVPSTQPSRTEAGSDAVASSDVPSGALALIAVETALSSSQPPSPSPPVCPAIVDEFETLLPERENPLPAQTGKASGGSVFARLTSFLRPKTVPRNDMAIERVEPLLRPDADFVKEALDFAASEASVEIPAVKATTHAPRRSEIESFLRRGNLIVDRPGSQPERESVALGLIASVAPDLLDAAISDETIAA